MSEFLLKKCILFIRNDDELLRIIPTLREKLDLKFIVFTDIKFDKKKLKKNFNLSNTEILTHSEFEELIKNQKIETDYILSYYYQKKLKKEVLDIAKRGAINIHPAPLPYYRGVGTYCLCILDELDYWASTAHYMDEKIDNGRIIKVKKFKIEKEKETYFSLEKKTKINSKILFEEVIQMIVEEKFEFEECKVEKEKIKYLSLNKLKELKKINEEDDEKIIKKKIRAFWCPPLMGAVIRLKDNEYTLINQDLLEIINEYQREGVIK